MSISSFWSICICNLSRLFHTSFSFREFSSFMCMFGLSRSWGERGGWCEARRWDIRFFEVNGAGRVGAGAFLCRILGVRPSSLQKANTSGWSWFLFLWMIFGKCSSLDFLWVWIYRLVFLMIFLLAISLRWPSSSKLTIELSGLPFLSPDGSLASASLAPFLLWLISGSTTDDKLRALRLTEPFLSRSLRFVLREFGSFIWLTWAMEWDRRCRLFWLPFALVFFNDFYEPSFSSCDCPLSASIFWEAPGLTGGCFFITRGCAGAGIGSCLPAAGRRPLISHGCFSGFLCGIIGF